MSKYRKHLPQLSGDLYLTDGGLETTLVFLEKIDLPQFAAFTLLKDEPGTEVLNRYFLRYAEMAAQFQTGLILESPTWRANRDWGQKIGYNPEQLAEVNLKSIKLLEKIRYRFDSPKTKVVISGNIGPRSDGYVPSLLMSAEEAKEYHQAQIETFSQTEADMVSAFTMNYTEEAIGIVAAAKKMKMPVVISFTVETDGKLPTGESLKQAIERTDEATEGFAAYFMINCAHPSHFFSALTPGLWLDRIRGIRANASSKSHTELNESITLDRGDPLGLARDYQLLRSKLKNLCVIGGCCGTDDEHIQEICKIFV